MREEPDLALEVRQNLRGVGDDTDEAERAFHVGPKICNHPEASRHPAGGISARSPNVATVRLAPGRRGAVQRGRRVAAFFYSVNGKERKLLTALNRRHDCPGGQLGREPAGPGPDSRDRNVLEMKAVRRDETLGDRFDQTLKRRGDLRAVVTRRDDVEHLHTDATEFSTWRKCGKFEPPVLVGRQCMAFCKRELPESEETRCTSFPETTRA